MVTSINSIYTDSLFGATVNLSKAYLKFGQNAGTSYTLVHNRVWEGTDHLEHWLLIAVRVLSWATVVFPLLAGSVIGLDRFIKYFTKKEPPIGEETIHVERSGRSEECKTMLEEQEKSHHTLFVKLIKPHHTIGLFGPDETFDHLRHHASQHSLVIIAQHPEVPIDAERVMNSRFIVNDSKICILSPRDSEAFRIVERSLLSVAFQHLLKIGAVN